jgi:DNA adenine methylase
MAKSRSPTKTKKSSLAPTRPVMRYHGAKWKLAEWIISHFPSHKIYVEPYGGSAAVLLQKARSYAEIYNDLDSDVVNLFRVLRDPDQARSLERMVRLTPFARDEFELAYVRSDDVVEQSRRLLFRSYAGHAAIGTHARMTGFRADSRESGSTPQDVWSNYPDEIVRFTMRMQGVVIENRPAIDVILRYDSADTLVYVDPPYAKSSRADQEDDYRYEMSDQDHRDLAAALHSFQGMVVLSGYASPLYDEELYSDWHRIEREALADGARKRTEVLWINPAAEKASLPLFAGLEDWSSLQAKENHEK